MQFKIHEEFAIKLDEEDELNNYRNYFYIPHSSIYVNGNSLGLMCSYSDNAIQRVVNEWKELGINGWFEGESPWFSYPEKVGAMAAELVGAYHDEVIATGSTTINIHSLISTFYQPDGEKTKILADELNFPTDVYALSGQIKLKQFDWRQNLILVPSKDGLTIDEELIVEYITDEVAVILLPSVLYKSGQLLDMPYLVKKAHEKGTIIGFDCSHSVGVIPHCFDEWDVDFAVWCSYKYLNAGPGSPAFLFINKKHFNREPLLAGWFGYKREKQFDLLLEFEHEGSARGWQVSSPAIIGLAAVEGAVRLILEIGIDKIRQKSLNLTSYLIYLIDEINGTGPYNLKIVTPRQEKRRGGHIAISHPQARDLCGALKKYKIITDFRPPNIIRIAPVPLYNSFHDVWYIVHLLKRIMDDEIMS